jgi:LacI family transcriptional regulator
MITQTEIARRLGVSQRAVAYALSDDPEAHKELSKETRQRIVKAAEKLGYRPNRYAQLMRGKKSGVIGMIHFASLVQSVAVRAARVAAAIHNAGYQLLADDLLWYPKSAKLVCDSMVDARVEGIVLCNPPQWFPPAELECFRRLKIPVVSISGMEMAGIPQIRADMRQGMFDLTQHLIAIGHRRLTLLASTTDEIVPKAQWPTTERIGGFKDALASNPTVHGEVVRTNYASDTLMDPYRIGMVAMQGLIASGDQLPDVLLCQNDDWALGALAACSEAGLRVPEDIAITGFDSTVFGAYGTTPLTSVTQANDEMANNAVQLLIQMIHGEKIAAKDKPTKWPCRLVVRKSCGSPVVAGKTS